MSLKIPARLEGLKNGGGVEGDTVFSFAATG